MLIQVIGYHTRMGDAIVIARQQNIKLRALLRRHVQIRRHAQCIRLHAQQDLHLRKFCLGSGDIRPHLRDLFHFDAVGQMPRSMVSDGDRADALRRRHAHIV